MAFLATDAYQTASLLGNPIYLWKINSKQKCWCKKHQIALKCVNHDYQFSVCNMASRLKAVLKYE